LGNGKNKKVESTFCNSVKGMEMNKDNVGRLKSHKLPPVW
jgi:hypothetical protein